MRGFQPCNLLARSPGGQNTAVVLRPVSFIEPTVLLASGLRGPGFTSHVWTPSLGGGEGPGSLPGNRPGGCAEGGDEWHPRQTCALGSWPLGGDWRCPRWCLMPHPSQSQEHACPTVRSCR